MFRAADAAKFNRTVALLCQSYFSTSYIRPAARFQKRKAISRKQKTEEKPMANNTAAVFTRHYDSPMGRILLAADEIGLRGLWFDGQKYFARDLPEKRIEQETHAIAEARRWLDVYFTGKEPDFLPPLHPIGSSADPLRAYHDLRRDRAAAGRDGGSFADVRAGRRRRRWA